MSYEEEIQKLGLGKEVFLYEIDLTVLGGGMYYFTPMSGEQEGLAEIRFGGNAYGSFPIKADGFEWVAGQSPPQPTVTVSNVDHAFTGDVLAYSNLVGATFRRIRTFERFLDTGTDPDSDSHMPIDVFRIDRKVAHNDEIISWELASWVDQQGVQLPKRIVVRDYCSLIYRNGSSGTFNYSKATCPYVGAAMFDRMNGAVDTPQQDICAHTLKACLKRFGNADLPFGGFPGVAKFRVQ